MSGFLLDTHVVLWHVFADRRLSKRAQSAIEAGEPIYVSAASTWELAIKRAAGKVQPPSNLLNVLRGASWRELNVTWEHGEIAATLKRVHGDPFDRMLAAQAIAENLVLVSADKVFRDYPVRILF